MNITVAEEVKQGKVVFTLMGKSGDDSLVWDASDPNQIIEAMAIFDEYMANGYIAFLIDENGQQGEQITKRDWERLDVRQREEIIFKRDSDGNVKAQEVHVVPNLYLRYEFVGLDNQRRVG